MYDLIILGGGPAGAGAAVYAARKQLKTLIITSEFGGQSTVSETIYNWIGTPEISGIELGLSLKKHVTYYEGDFLDITEGEKVKDIKKEENSFSITTDKGKSYQAKAIIIATGSSRKKLLVENAEKYEHKGITYCASCDGPLFSDQDVAVIGGGNAGFETAMQLVAYSKSVTLFESNSDFKADPITIDKISLNPKFKSFKNVEILKVDGEQFVKSITYKNRESGNVETLEVTGIFVEIGQTPNTNFAKDVLDIDGFGRIIINPKTQATSCPGIWAAGDCTDGKYHQNNIATGDAVKALEDAYIWIKNN